MSASSADPATSVLDAARAAVQRGDAAGAAAKCRELLAGGRDDAATWTLLGVALRGNDPVAAEDALRQALERDMRHADAHFHLGNLWREQRRFDEAVSAYDTALAIAPGHASILNNLGLACEGAGQGARAASCYREVLRIQPQHRQALGNLAHLLCRNREFPEALSRCEEYLRAYADPEATVLVDHGICQQYHLHDAAGAEASYRRAAALAPDDVTCLLNLGSLSIERGDYDQASAVLSRAVAVAPRDLNALTLLALARQHLCAWEGQDALHAEIAARIAHGPDEDCLANPFALLSLAVPPASQRRVAERWARLWLPTAPLAPRRPASGPSPPRRKLRVGYLSSDFREHAIAYLLTEVWERHDRTRIESTAYSIGAREESPLRKRIERAFDRFVDAYDETPTRTAQRIRDDGIDILIDLNGYTRGARSDIAAMRPAPVQLSWLGYLGTQGAGWVDYIITDRFVTPDDQQSAFTERFLRLPDSYCPTDTRREVAAPPRTRAAAGLPAEGFVFCCFNNTYKIGPAIFDVWMRILDELPRSVLWLSPGNATATRNLRSEAKARAIDPDRLVFAGHLPLREHLARHVHADLFLDTAPYNAGTTANDALLMGLPVLTCSGTTMASRVAGSQLRAAGLPELVAGDLAHYEALAVKLAREPTLLAGLRERLRANRHSAPLFDMARFTRNLESALLGAWDEHVTNGIQ